MQNCNSQNNKNTITFSYKKKIQLLFPLICENIKLFVNKKQFLKYHLLEYKKKLVRDLISFLLFVIYRL